MRARHLLRPLIVAVAVALLPAAIPAAAATHSGPTPAHAAIPTDQLHPDESAATPKVVNGQRTTVRENPSLITGLRVGGGGPQGASCTASVVGRNKILTAAHCMIDATGAKSYLYGDDDLNTPGDETFRTKLASYKVHPKYTGTNSWQNGYDVAVVTTVDDIPVPPSQWAKVAGSGDSALTQPGRTGTAFGWGKTSANGSTGVLNKTTMPVNDAANCQVFDIRVNPDLMVCIGYNDGRTATCSGDSGGPFTVDGVVVGLVSWGASNCDRYSIMSRLTNTMGDWAKGEIGSDPGDGTFSVALDPASGRVDAGKYVSTGVSTQAGGAGAEKVDLSATGLPAGTTATFQPTSIQAGEGAKVTFETTGQTPKGNHTITVQAKSASGTKTATYTLTVDGGTDPGDGTFSVALDPASGRVDAGKYVSTTLTSQAGGTGAEQIDLSATGLPAGTTATFQPTSIRTGENAKVTFETTGQTPKGNHTITVQAKSASGTKTATYTLTVDGGTDPGEGTFSVALNPTSGRVDAGNHVSTALTTQAGSAGAEDIALSATGLPAGTTAMFQPTSIQAGDAAKVTFETSAQTPKGNYAITVQAKSASGTKTATYTLTVDGTTTTEGPKPVLAVSSGTISRGQMFQTNVTVTGGQGSSKLTATGVTMDPMFFPSTVAQGGTSQMTVFAPFQAGVYKVTVTATDQAGKKGTAEFTLTVR
ncbi:trypsin-like serine protease [Streptomyces sp. DT24]|uniref:trypsin-like serine protease n=1 Tax=Streptomyces sp. DT24 TaxID=3416520 RepID=UPI003CF6FDA2